MKAERGDTIIEVILAGAILALVTVSSFSIMQRASSSAYDALERSVVRLEINTQTELLNYFRDSYVKALADGSPIVPDSPADQWLQITAVPEYTGALNLETCELSDSAFYLNKNGLGDGPVVVSEGRPEAGKGLWVFRVDPPGGPPIRNYHDFYILSCWESTTSNQQRMSSVVRLYDPKP